MDMKISLDKGAFMPERAHDLDAGLDLFALDSFMVPAHGYTSVDTGVHIELPSGTRGHVCSKSGLNRSHGITCDGTIDEGYSGSIGVTLHNSSSSDCWFGPGKKIAQLVVEKILRPDLVLVDKVGGGERGDNGFGSTGE